MQRLFAGLDLCRADFRLSVAEVTSTNPIALTQQETILVDPPEMLSILCQRLKLARHPKLKKPEFELDCVQTALQPYADQLVSHNSFARGWQCLAATFPYSLPPPIRRKLPDLVGLRIGELPGKYVSLEAPLSMCIDLVATGQVDSPKTILLCSPCTAGIELTLVALETRGTRLDVRVLAYQEVLSDAVNPTVLDWKDAPNSLVDEAINVFVAGQELSKTAEQWTAARGIPMEHVHFMDASIASTGAARYAAFKSDGSIHGTNISEVHFHRICPRPIGVLGSNRNGVGFWRYLIPAGGTYGQNYRLAVSSDAADQYRVAVLCEVTKPCETVPRWLMESEWPEMGIQIFASAPLNQVSPAPQTKVIEVNVSLRNPEGPLLWKSQKTCRVTYHKSDVI